MSETVRHFFVHDDAKGPYVRGRIGRRREWVYEDRRRTISLLTVDGRRVHSCLVALPPRVNMRLQDVMVHARAWVQHLRSRENRLFRIRPDLVLRPYLRLSRTFKEGLLRHRAGRPRDPIVVGKYRCMQMPKYVWVVEVAERGELLGKAPQNRLIRGEMLFDSTANRHSEEALLAFYYNGVLLMPNRQHTRLELRRYPGFRPYSPLLRVSR